jgi:hypothetical protein
MGLHVGQGGENSCFSVWWGCRVAPGSYSSSSALQVPASATQLVVC